MMNNSSKIGVALVGGYLLGRTKKAKMAIGLGMFLAGKKLNLDPKQLASMITDSQLLGGLNEQVRKELLDTTKSAATSALTKRIGGFADSLRDRTLQLDGGDDDGREARDTDERDEPDERDERDAAEPGGEEDDRDLRDDRESGSDDEPAPPARRKATRSASGAAEKAKGQASAPRKTASSTRTSGTAKKTASSARKTTSGTRKTASSARKTASGTARKAGNRGGGNA